MKIDNEIKELINRLLALHLNKGVQPSELSEAIFEDSYESIKMEKSSEYLNVFLTFNENIEGKANSITMKYQYGLNQELLSISQRIGRGKFELQWDRNFARNEIISELIQKMSLLNDPELVSQFINTIPQQLKSQIAKNLSLVA